MKKTSKSLKASAARIDRPADSDGIGHDRNLHPALRSGQLVPDHPFFSNRDKILDRGTVVKKGELRKTATHSGLGADYIIARVSEQDGEGYITMVTITTSWDLNYGLFVSRNVSWHHAYFPSTSECQSWIKRRAMSKEKIVE